MHRTHKTTDSSTLWPSLPAISARTINQFAMISAAIAVKVRCKLDLKSLRVQLFVYS